MSETIISKSSNRRVVITGLGVISALGLSLSALKQSFCSGQSGIRPFRWENSSWQPLRYSSAVSEFTGNIENFGELEPAMKKTIRKSLKLMSREIQMGVASAQRALQDAQIGFHQFPSDRIGVSFGSDFILTTTDELSDGIRNCLDAETGQFDFSRWAKNGICKMTPLWQLKFLPNMPSSHMAILNDFHGPSNSITNREASVGAVLGEAGQIIRLGKADIMLVGATGSRVHPWKIIHALQSGLVAQNNLEQLGQAQNSEQQCNQEQNLQSGEIVAENEAEAGKMISAPFDQRASGVILGEGAGALILEELEHAQKRGAAIYGEFLGGLCRADILPGGAISVDKVNIEDSLTRTMRQLFETTGISPSEVDVILAQGYSVPVLDAMEARAIRNVFGSDADRIPVTTLSPLLGNPGASGGAIDLIAGLLAMNDEMMFPLWNHRELNPDCPILPLREIKQGSVNLILKIAFNRLGQTSALLVRRFQNENNFSS